jgi:hypothetical protein
MADDPAIIQRAYDLVLWAVPTIAKFPRSYRFVLGERMEHALYEVLEALIEARYDRRNRPELLARVNIWLEKLRFQTRLAKDLNVLGIKQYEHFARLADGTKAPAAWL